MSINFTKSDTGDVAVLFQESSISLEFQFTPDPDLNVEKIIQLKGLLNCHPIKKLEITVFLDQAHSLSLCYIRGHFTVKMTNNSTTLHLPIIGKEVYGQLDNLLNHLLPDEGAN